MATETHRKVQRRTAKRASWRVVSDWAFRWGTALFCVGILALAVYIFYALVMGALPSIHAFGPSFLWRTNWDITNEQFGAVDFLAGSLITSAVALVIAVPLALGIAILLSEYATTWVRETLSFGVELLAAIPSVVYGLWGIYVLAPIMAHEVNPAIKASPLGLLPIFGKPTIGDTLLTASVILAIMILPIIAAISREVLLAVPASQREAGLALGLTRWEVSRKIVVAYGKGGIVGAILLGLGRAIGETIAVTMVIGQSPQFTYDLFQPGYTMSSVIANEFGDASDALHTASLYEIALLLFVTSLLVNVIARLLVGRTRHGGSA
ncbi:MAG: phosphate ABC transporter permease subunit PstC [Thermoplasmatota archaeon]